MDVSDLKNLLKQLQKASKRFKDALAEDPFKNEFAIDAAIQRFEFTFELAWKVLQRVLKYQGVTVVSPREAFKAGYKRAWLQQETAWLDMIEDRNLTSHTYNEKLAKKVYANLSPYAQLFDELNEKLQEVLKNL